MKIRKNALMLSAIVMLLISTFAIMPSMSQGSTKLTIDTIDNPGLGVGSTFTVYIWVWDVEAMFGYNFLVYYDTSVLTATNFMRYPPFTIDFPSDIDDAKGVVALAASMESPELVGFYWSGQYPIASIDFSVDALGGSMLDITGSVISDIYGDPIAHTVEDGWFRNVAGVPIAWFPPMDPMIGESVTFTSTSFDPDGTIVAFDWDWGDGTSHGTLMVDDHAWTTEGTYTVVLTVTDNDGLTDSQAASIEITRPPPPGAIAIEGWTSYTGVNPGTSPKLKILDFTKYGDKKLMLKAMVKNLDDELPVLVRVIFWIYELESEEMMASIEMPWTWLDPAAKELFQTSFSSVDCWPYGSPVAGFDVGIDVYYVDYFIGGDPNNPHWAIVEDPPELPIMFGAKESPPVPVFALIKEADPFTYTLDATGSYDLDEKFGDFIDHGITRWVIVDPEVGVIALVYGATTTFTFDHAGTYLVQMRIHDSFGVRVYNAGGAYVPIEVTE